MPKEKLTERNEKNLEVAKSWFELSRLCAVIAGLFLVLASLQSSSYVGLKYNLDTPIKACDFIIQHNLNEKNLSYNECMGIVEYGIGREIEQNQKITNILIFLGFLMIFNSFLLWIVGRKKLRNSEIEDVKLVWIVFILNIAIIFLVWFLIFKPLDTLPTAITIGNRTFDFPLS